MTGLDGRAIDMDDMGAWQLGRKLAGTFSEPAVRAFREALDQLAEMPDSRRLNLVASSLDVDAQIDAADRLLRVLRLSVT